MNRLIFVFIVGALAAGCSVEGTSTNGTGGTGTGGTGTGGTGTGGSGAMGGTGGSGTGGSGGGGGAGGVETSLATEFVESVDRTPRGLLRSYRNTPEPTRQARPGWRPSSASIHPLDGSRVLAMANNSSNLARKAAVICSGLGTSPASVITPTLTLRS